MVELDSVAGFSVTDLAPRTGTRIRTSPGHLSPANLKLGIGYLGGMPHTQDMGSRDILETTPQ